MKREQFCRMGSQGLALWIETTRDWNGRSYVCYRPHTSLLLDNSKAVLKWAGYPKQTNTRAELEAWLQGVEDADAARVAARTAQANPGLSDELLATGFGPEAHGPEAHGLDESDPNHQTRMVT